MEFTADVPLFSLSPPAGHQVSQRLAEEAQKRERFKEMKQQLELDQEVRSILITSINQSVKPSSAALTCVDVVSVA